MLYTLGIWICKNLILFSSKVDFPGVSCLQATSFIAKTTNSFFWTFSSKLVLLSIFDQKEALQKTCPPMYPLSCLKLMICFESKNNLKTQKYGASEVKIKFQKLQQFVALVAKCQLQQKKVCTSGWHSETFASLMSKTRCDYDGDKGKESTGKRASWLEAERIYHKKVRCKMSKWLR